MRTLPRMERTSVSQFERITCIDRTLRERGDLRCQEIADRYEVSTRQIKRDIEYMRDRLGAPIVYHRKGDIYRYDKPFDTLLFADEKLLIFYALLKSLALNEHYVPVVSTDLLAEVESHISDDYRPVAERISYALSISESIDMEDFTTISQAMLLGDRLDIEYESAGGDRTQRSVEPKRLVNYGGRWYVIAFDLLRDDLRTFHLSRLVRCAASHERATFGDTPTNRAAVDAYVASGFGMFNGAETKEATVRIHGTAAAIVARQTWHPAQRITRCTTADGVPYTDITVPVSHWQELLGRVLSFGSAAEALAPEEFRELWKAEVEKMTRRAGV